MKKLPVGYIDMDGVIADFDAGVKKYAPDLHTGEEYPDYDTRADRVDKLCEANPYIFHDLPLIEGAIEAVEWLMSVADIYFLSTPMWNVPLSYTGKREWLGKHFGEKAKKRLILTHRKDLNVGDFLIDDRLRNGVDKFTGVHFHFATPLLPDWKTTRQHIHSWLLSRAMDGEASTIRYRTGL